MSYCDTGGMAELSVPNLIEMSDDQLYAALGTELLGAGIGFGGDDPSRPAPRRRTARSRSSRTGQAIIG
jgi:hypothetical protein